MPEYRLPLKPVQDQPLLISEQLLVWLSFTHGYLLIPMAASISLCYQLQVLQHFQQLIKCPGKCPAYPNPVSLLQGKVNHMQQALCSATINSQ